MTTLLNTLSRFMILCHRYIPARTVFHRIIIGLVVIYIILPLLIAVTAAVIITSMEHYNSKCDIRSIWFPHTSVKFPFHISLKVLKKLWAELPLRNNCSRARTTFPCCHIFLNSFPIHYLTAFIILPELLRNTRISLYLSFYSAYQQTWEINMLYKEIHSPM